MLEVCDVSTAYGKVQALWDVCIEVKEGEIVALVGSNGAGKTTLLNTITGLLAPVSGSVQFLGRRIDGLPPPSQGRGRPHALRRHGEPGAAAAGQGSPGREHGAVGP